MNSQHKKKSPVTIPDKVLVKQQPETLERLLVVGAIKSGRFFRQIRSKVCPWMPDKQCHRPDFDNRHYNQVWPVIESWWARFDKVPPPPNDFDFPPAHLENYLHDRAKAGIIPVDEAIAIKELLWPELENLEFTPELYQGLISCEAFSAWLEDRVSHFEVKNLHSQIASNELTAQAIKEALDRINAVMSPLHHSMVNPRDVLLGERLIKRPVMTGIHPLDEALGGGLHAPECVMIAAAMGAGKTALAAQLEVAFARTEQRALHVTTEEPPEMLILRMIANVCNVDFRELRRGTKIVFDAEDKAVIKNVPEWVWKDKARYNQLVRLGDMLATNIRIIDWSKGQGKSVTKDLTAEVEAIKATGFVPNILLVDWIGGTICANSASERDERNKINRQYQEAADFVVNCCKQWQMVGIVFAQCDTKMVKSTTKQVTKDMLSECKTMARNYSAFIGMSSLKSEASEGRLDPVQYLNPDKSRYGTGGLVEVRANLKHQRFESPSTNIGGRECR